MRRHTTITISAAGRDKGKTFRLTEMPAEEGEYWATRALELIQGEVKGGGMAELADAAASGINIARRLQNPDLDGMWKYVQFQPENKEAPAQKLREDHIEEWQTRLDLRAAFFKLHVGFFSPESPSISASASGPSPS